MAEVEEVLNAWSSYLATVDDWQNLVKGIEPKFVGCGSVYELPNPIDRPNESFAIADMRELKLAEPHKHINGETEIYFVIRGAGKIAVGSEVTTLYRGVSVVTPPNTVHITKPLKGLVMAVVNTPPFNADNYIAVDPNEPEIAETIHQLS